MPLATVRTIARALGLGKSTVAAALRNDPEVSEGTRQRVTEAAKRLGYKVNPFVAALMSQQRRSSTARKHPVIAYVEMYANPAQEAIAHLDTGFRCSKEEAQRIGYRLERFPLRNDDHPPEHILRILRARGIQGVILVHGGTHEIAEEHDWTSFSVVEMAPQPEFSSVRGDALEAGRLALSELRKLGYKRIGWMTDKSAILRDGGRWLLAMHEHNIHCPAAQRVQPLILDPDDDPQRAFKSWIKRTKPDCIGPWSKHVVSWIGSSGNSVPDDIALFSPNLLPSERGHVAGIDTRYELRMAEAIHLLDGLLKRNETGVPSIPLKVVLPPQWCHGDTAPGRVQ